MDVKVDVVCVVFVASLLNEKKSYLVYQYLDYNQV